jgi:hypothetical protein
VEALALVTAMGNADRPARLVELPPVLLMQLQHIGPLIVRLPE